MSRESMLQPVLQDGDTGRKKGKKESPLWGTLGENGSGCLTKLYYAFDETWE